MEWTMESHHKLNNGFHHGMNELQQHQLLVVSSIQLWQKMLNNYCLSFWVEFVILGELMDIPFILEGKF